MESVNYTSAVQWHETVEAADISDLDFSDQIYQFGSAPKAQRVGHARIVPMCSAFGESPVCRSASIALAFGLIFGNPSATAASARVVSPVRIDHEERSAPIEERRAAAVERLKRRIEQFAERADGWDGDDGRAPTKDAQLDSMKLLELLPAGFLPKAVYSPGDGEVLYQWERKDAFIEIGFYGDGTISWYLRRGNGVEEHGDDPFDRDQPVLNRSLEMILGVSA